MAKKKNIKSNIEIEYPKKVDTRLQQLRFNMEDLKVDALVITHLPNIRYLTNFSGSAATLILTYEEIFFVTDDRYEEQIKTELYSLSNLHTFISRDVWGLIKDKKILRKIESIGFEADKIPYSDAVLIRNLIRPMKFKPANMVIEKYNIPKSHEEISFIEQSAKMTEQVYDTILPMIQIGVSEIEIAAEISYQSRKLGSEGDPFDIIVVSGERGALVHGRPSRRIFKKGDIILMDFGCKVNGFCSDITRTVALGKATKEQKNLYKIIVEAKENAITNVRPNMNGKILDEFARSIIRKNDYGDYFKHSLGHGIGLSPHELPIITFRLDDQVLPENCVVAIEPGVYLPDKFGIRVEDMIEVTRMGGRHLTKAPEELLIVG